MKYSLSSFVYFNAALQDAIDQTAAFGYDGIDIWGGRPHAFRRDLSEADCLELRRQTERLGLAVASFIPAQFRYPTCLCSPIPAIHEDSIAYIQDSILTASRLGAPIVSVCPGHTLRGQSQQDGWEKLKFSLLRICQFASVYRIKIAIEPADHYETDLVNTIADAARLIAETDMANLGVLLDSGHVHVSAEPMADAFKAAGDRLFHIHIDDNLGKRDQHLIPGEGNIDFAEFYRLVTASGYRGYLCAELSWDYTADPDMAARQTIERLRALERLIE